MFHRTPRIPLAALALAVAISCGCGANVGVNRGFDDLDSANEYLDAQSPEAFVDRLGEPDEWRNEGTGDRLKMTAVWNCLKGERRQVTWRIRSGDRRGQGWELIQDARTQGECD